MSDNIAGLIFFAFIISVIYVFFWITIRTETITVSDKGIIVKTTNGDKTTTHSVHMIYTTNGQALTNKNCFWLWKWRSDELQAQFRVGHTYRIKTCGFRIPILGTHKNIISATEIK